MLPAPTLFYDGDCALCSRSVKFVLRHEKSEAIRFCAMQSEKGKILLVQMGIDSVQPGSLIFTEGEQTYISYQAVARIATYLRFPWSLFGLMRMLPPFIGNRFYYLIARNRRRFFGINESCMMVVKGKEGRFEGDR